jgi:predicted  nucleic acid-binding Zn-ribbon protein
VKRLAFSADLQRRAYTAMQRRLEDLRETYRYLQTKYRELHEQFTTLQKSYYLIQLRLSRLNRRLPRGKTNPELCRAQQMSRTRSRTPTFHKRFRALILQQRLTLLCIWPIRS